MTLPPFPFLPASPEERLRLTQYGELVRAMYKDDAERYRWLRDVAHPDTNGGLRCVGNCADSGTPLHIAGRDLDRAVDAARGAEANARTSPQAPAEWATKQMDVLIMHLRQDTHFDADLIEQMLTFAQNAARGAE